MDRSASATLLSVLGVFFVNQLFAMAMLLQADDDHGIQAVVYIMVVALYGALYLRRRLSLRNQREGLLYNGLGYAAVALGLLLSATFFYAVGAGMPPPLAAGVWLCLATAAYFIYRVIVLHLDDKVPQVQASLLSALAVAFVHLLFAMAILLQQQAEDHGREPGRAVVLYLIAVAFYSALYFRRRLLLRHQLGAIYNGLGYTAVALGLLLSAIFFYAVGAAMPLPLAIGVWLGLAIAAFFFYRVMVLHLEADDEEVALQGQEAGRAPV